ncbi:MAG: hypothetical protein QOG67_3252 [Verrucomicrobiota bacterium]
MLALGAHGQFSRGRVALSGILIHETEAPGTRADCAGITGLPNVRNPPTPAVADAGRRKPPSLGLLLNRTFGSVATGPSKRNGPPSAGQPQPARSWPRRTVEEDFGKQLKSTLENDTWVVSHA